MDNQNAPDEDLTGAVEGLLACLEVGLAHLSPEQRRFWADDADPNLLLAPLKENAPPG